MPKFNIAKSISIDAPLEKVHAIVRDFKQWICWSPWLIADPECKVQYADDGDSYSWDGEIAGAGEMKISSENAPNTIEYELTFLKPWKSTSQVSFSFRSEGESTKATWTMDGSLPFFMFWMKKMMVAFVGMDYDRGLSMLKDYCETGAVPSKISFAADQSFPGFTYLGISATCTIPEIGDKMMADFKTLTESMGAAGVDGAGKPFSIYHKYDIPKQLVAYTIGVPINERPRVTPEGLTPNDFPSCKTYAIDHYGPYRHLGNAWSAGAMHSRAKVFKQVRGIHPFEVYHNDPQETPENELETTVHFPMV